ncbi:MAG TPA: hypothetical protein DIU15_13185 [Deltaproteobacteria bacterium]|nr:hypothetical protein [Deltaproteobacteria bacterium]
MICFDAPGHTLVCSVVLAGGLLTAGLCWPALALGSGGPESGLGSLQSEGRAALAPARTVDIEHLALDLRIDVIGGKVSGKATHRVRALGPEVAHVDLHQVALQITDVLVDGRSAGFRTGRDSVTVTLPEPLALGQAAELEFLYTAEPTTGLHFRGPGPDSPDRYFEAWSQGEDIDNRHWFPSFDDPRDRFTYEGRFTVEKQFTVVSNGVVEEQRVGEDGWVTWHFNFRDQDLVNYLVAVAIGPYRTVEEQWRDRPVYYHLPPDVDDETASRVVGETVAMLDYFSEVTGVEYPYPLYRQVFVQRFIYTGMENTTATVMDRGLFHPERTREHRRFGEAVVAHELAHQWYGDQLTCRTWRHMWLNEGFATFFEGLWWENSGKAGADADARRIRNRFRSVIRRDKTQPRPLVLRFFNRRDSDAVANPYSKGASILQMLRVMLGDEVFFRGIRRYTQVHQHSLVETEDFRRVMEEVSGQPLRWFFDQWVYLAGHPKLKVSQRVDDGDGRLTLTIAQTQEVQGLVPRFTLPIEVDVVTSESSRREVIWMDGLQASIVLPLDGTLRYVAVDPRGGLLAEVEQVQPPAQWVAQLESPAAYARLVALDALKAREGKPTDSEFSAVRSILDDGSASAALRVRATAVLGEWRDRRSVDAVVEALRREKRTSNSSSEVRLAMTRALGLGLPREAVRSALTSVLAHDPVEHVRAQALRSLARLEEEAVRPRALAALRAPATDQWVLQRAAAEILGRWGRSDELAALERVLVPGTPHRLRHTVLHAAARLVGRQDPGEQRRDLARRVARAAEPMLDDLYLRTRQTAVAVLDAVGDSRSIAALEALRRRDNFRPLRERARVATERIRSRDDSLPAPTEGELKAKVKTLEERLDELEKELGRLQQRR